jgi:GYF domain 2
MANYTIIGGDGKQYGPITEGDLRKWIAEGRLNAQSLVKSESDAEFRPLGTFPEMADAFGPPSAPPGIAPVFPVAGRDRNTGLDKVRVPAIGLIISSVISFLMSAWGLARIGQIAAQKEQIDSMLSQMNNPQAQQFVDTFIKFFSGPFGIIQYLLMMLISVLIFAGALKMLKLRSYEFAYAAAIMAVIPCLTPCCGWILGLIFGIWAMAVLGKAKPYFT